MVLGFEGFQVQGVLGRFAAAAAAAAVGGVDKGPPFWKLQPHQSAPPTIYMTKTPWRSGAQDLCGPFGVTRQAAGSPWYTTRW